MSLTFEQVYPASYEYFTSGLEEKMGLPFYPIQINFLQSPGIDLPCIYMSSIQMPNESFCFDVGNFKIIFNMTIADKAIKNDTVKNVSNLLGYYGKFVDIYDSREATIDVNGENFIVKGDIINSSVRFEMRFDLTLGFKTLDFQFMYEFVKQGGV